VFKNKKSYLILHILIIFLIMNTNIVCSEVGNNNLSEELKSILKSTRFEDDINILETKEKFKDFLYKYDNL